MVPHHYRIGWFGRVQTAAVTLKELLLSVVFTSGCWMMIFRKKSSSNTRSTEPVSIEVYMHQCSTTSRCSTISRRYLYAAKREYPLNLKIPFSPTFKTKIPAQHKYYQVDETWRSWLKLIFTGTMNKQCNGRSTWLSRWWRCCHRNPRWNTYLLPFSDENLRNVFETTSVDSGRGNL